MRAKIWIVVISATFLCLGAAFRAGTTLLDPVAIRRTPNDGGAPVSVAVPWYFSKACFYLFNFTIEICIVIFWLVVRIDKRFHIPDGAKGPFSYAGGFVFAGENGNEKRRVVGNRESMRKLTGSTTSLGHVGDDGSRVVSWANGSRTSFAASSRISWGGISQQDLTVAYGEDGMEPLPYMGYYHPTQHPRMSQASGIGANRFSQDNESAAQDDEAEERDVVDMHQPDAFDVNDVDIDGVEQEMGWDAKSGKWALRPLTRTSRRQRPSLEVPASGAQSLQMERLSPDGQRLSPNGPRIVSPDGRRRSPDGGSIRTFTLSAKGGHS